MMIPYSLYFVFLFFVVLICYLFVCPIRGKSIKQIWERGEFIAVLGLACILSFIMCMVFSGGSIVYSHHQFQKSEYRIEQREKLVAFQNKFGVSGSFFLGSGDINGTAYYYYLIKKQDGAVQMHSIVAEGMNVYQEDNQDPCVVWVSYYNPQYAKWFPCQQIWKPYFVIPTNSMNYNFNLSLEK